MQHGGIYDVVGGGFHRYAVDAIWCVPHFEKMLYDNAQLALAYLHGYLMTGDASFRLTCEETLDFIQRELMHPAGGFFSSLDADSEGEEGKFYIWTMEEIEKTLSNPEDFELARAVYQLTPHGNFEGRIVLQRPAAVKTLAEALDLSVDELFSRLNQLHRQLFAARSNRVRPATDDKVLVSWNALALRAFSEAARYLNRDEYLVVAQKNANFLLNDLHNGDRLLRSWRNGSARHNAFLEDYAGLASAFLSLYQTDHDLRWYHHALSLVEEMKIHFKDESGGFYDVRDDQTDLIVRPKEYQDNPIPSGNSLAAKALLELSSFSGDTQEAGEVESILATLQDALTQHPTAFAYWLQCADLAAGPVDQIALLWTDNQSEHKPFLQALNSQYRPRLVIAASSYPPSPKAPQLLRDRPTQNGQVTAYVCRGFVCRQPVTTVDEFVALLASQEW